MFEPRVLHEDNHLLVVVKPAGMPVQGDKSGDPDLLSNCREYIRVKFNKPGNVYLGLVHRLDRNVSGPVVFARTSKAAARLSKQFREHSPGKIYHALVAGRPETDAGERRDYIIKDGRTRTARPGRPEQSDAKEAILNWRLLDSKLITKREMNNRLFPEPGDPEHDDSSMNEHPVSLLEIELKTGRFHQIRFQLSRMGLPILGDAKYRSRFFLRNHGLALEAVRLDILHPVGKTPLSMEGEFRLRSALSGP